MASQLDRLVGRAISSVPITRVTFRVDAVLKGEPKPVVILEQTSGPNFTVIDDPGYIQGDHYRLYLRKIGENLYRIVNPDGRIAL